MERETVIHKSLFARYSRKRFIILLSIISVLLFWRYSYFIFVPNITSLPQATNKQVSPAIIKALFVHRDTDTTVILRMSLGIKTDSTILSYKSKSRGEEYGDPFWFTSPKYGWTRTFDDYYKYGSPEAENESYVVLYFSRGPDWNPDSWSGPTFMLNFKFNRAKINWDDIYIINLKTGATFKHFREDSHKTLLLKACYDAATNAFYFRFYEQKNYYYLKLK